MNANTVNTIMDDTLEEFVRIQKKVDQCLAAYRHECQRLIEEIGKGSRSDSDEKFDMLFDFTGRLSRAWFVLHIDIGTDLEKIVREFERLHDSYIRDYWYKRFQAGERWPA